MSLPAAFIVGDLRDDVVSGEGLANIDALAINAALECRDRLVEHHFDASTIYWLRVGGDDYRARLASHRRLSERRACHF